MKIFITGTNGQLGYDVAKECLKRNYQVIGCGTQSKSNNELNIQYIQLDITDELVVLNTIQHLQPNIIIHCAAWTNVDTAELSENYNKVYDINVNATKYLAQAASQINAKIIYISTDYVFNGNGDIAWIPGDIENPLNVYGKTKFAGELFISKFTNKYFIIRTSWVFGINGNNFIKTMLKLSKTKTELNIINDQIGRPTYTVDLAKLICDMMITNKYGLYHVSNEGKFISWYDFAKEIFNQANINIKINSITTKEYNNPTPRPKNSRLDTSKIKNNNFQLLPDWQNALKRYLQEVQI